MNEGVLPPDNMTRWPPRAYVRMFGLRYQDVSVALTIRCILRIKILQLIHSFEIKSQTSLGSENFQTKVIFPAWGHPCCLEGPDRAVFKCGEKRGCVIG